MIISPCAVKERTTGRRKVTEDAAADTSHESTGVVARTRSTSPSTSHRAPKEGEMSSRSASNSAAYRLRHVAGYNRAAQRIKVLMLLSFVDFRSAQLVPTTPAAPSNADCPRR